MKTLSTKHCTITRMTSGVVPVLPYEKILLEIFGKETKYELSIVFPTNEFSKTINEQYKHHEGVANILSFPIDKNSGEIFLSLSKARKQAGDFGHDYKTHLIFLLIHGILHLKGMTHGHAMEKEEKRLVAKFVK